MGLDPAAPGGGAKRGPGGCRGFAGGGRGPARPGRCRTDSAPPGGAQREPGCRRPPPGGPSRRECDGIDRKDAAARGGRKEPQPRGARRPAGRRSRAGGTGSPSGIASAVREPDALARSGADQCQPGDRDRADRGRRGCRREGDRRGHPPSGWSVPAPHLWRN